MKKYIYIVALGLATIMSSCGEDFLTRYPDGGSISQDKFDELGTEKLEGTLRGLYSMIYTDGSSDHDAFGQRSIDLWGDILCGDIAVTGKTYGWLYTDEQMMTVTSRTGYFWSFYYQMIHNINTTVRSINSQDDILALCQKNGWPSEGDYEWTEEDVTYALYLAQALALRGYAYGNIVRWYTPTPEAMAGVVTIKTNRCAPYYDELNMDEAQPRSYSEEIYTHVFQDLKDAIRLFDEFGTVYYNKNKEEYKRESKLAIDINVARGLLAYAALNAIPYYGKGSAEYNQLCLLAKDNAEAVINSGAFQPLTRSRLLTTGFNSVTEPSWMWGQEVTVETAGGLKSWFGQVDIHSYSYAWAGDTKVIDANLRDEMPLWDARKMWFNDGSKNKKFKDCPDGKFFSAACPTSTKDVDIDREWLSDNVFMRYESMILIAAEACMYLGDNGAAYAHLKTLLDERINTDYPFYSEEYSAYLTEIQGNVNKLNDAIMYNWRVEMWGEGYGLQTFRRMQNSEKGIERVRGGNHDSQSGAKVTSSDINFNMQIPSSEITYNPMIPEDEPASIVRYTILTEKN